MAEVRVKIGADIKDLQKGVKDAQREVSELGQTAKAASGSLSGTAKSIDEIKASATKAIAESRALRAQLDGVAEAGDNAGNAAGQLGEKLEGGFGGAARAATSLASRIAGGLGITVLIQAALELKDRFVEAFTAGEVAAENAKSAFESTFKSITDFNALKGEVRVFEDRSQILEAAAIAKREIAAIESQIEAAGSTASRSEGFLGIDAQLLDNVTRTTLGFFSEAQKQNNILIDILKKKRGEQEGELKVLTQQLEEYDRRIKASQNLSEAEIRTRGEIEGQVVALKEAKKTAEELLKLRAAAFVAVGANTPIGSRRTPQAATPLPNQPDKVFDEGAAGAASDFAKALQGISASLDSGLITSLDATNERLTVTREYLRLLAINGQAGTQTFNQLKESLDALELEQKQAAINAQVLQGTDVFTEFGVAGVGALADIALGFEKLENLGNIVKDIIRQLVKDLILAAAKAAILSLLFPGASQAAGGFKALFRGNLGLPPIGGAPSQSLINAPAAVAPLGRLAQASQSAQVVIPELTIRGNDLVVAFQRARAGSARTLGNIPLK